MELLEKLKNLLVMAAADGTFTEREINFLADRCVQWGLSEDDFAAAIEYALQDGAHLHIPEQRHECVEMLQDLIRMMAADGRLAEMEKRLFATAAVKMGISDEELNAIIDSVL